jgi:hypothetical protein
MPVSVQDYWMVYNDVMFGMGHFLRSVVWLFVSPFVRYAYRPRYVKTSDQEPAISKHLDREWLDGSQRERHSRKKECIARQSNTQEVASASPSE